MFFQEGREQRNMNHTDTFYIISFKSFTLADRKEAIKEIAIVNIVLKNAALYRFSLPTPYARLTESEKISVKRATTEEHGLLYTNYHNDLNPQLIPHILSRIALECKKSNKPIAYSGTAVGKTLLEEAGFPQINNIEDTGCPALNTLHTREPYREITHKFHLHLSPYTHISCPHQLLRTGAPSPCALMEALYIGAWILHTYGPSPPVTTNNDLN